jgi:hypothetical protein
MDAHKGKGEVDAMKAYGVVEAHFLSFLASGLRGGEWSDSCPSSFIPEKQILVATE